jgi:hypothetical protein
LAAPWVKRPGDSGWADWVHLDFLCQRKHFCLDIWGWLSAKQFRFCDEEIGDFVIIRNAGMEGMAIDSIPLALYGHINARLVLVS